MTDIKKLITDLFTTNDIEFSKEDKENYERYQLKVNEPGELILRVNMVPFEKVRIYAKNSQFRQAQLDYFDRRKAYLENTLREFLREIASYGLVYENDFVVYADGEIIINISGVNKLYHSPLQSLLIQIHPLYKTIFNLTASNSTLMIMELKQLLTNNVRNFWINHYPEKNAYIYEINGVVDKALATKLFDAFHFALQRLQSDERVKLDFDLISLSKGFSLDQYQQLLTTILAQMPHDYLFTMHELEVQIASLTDNLNKSLNCKMFDVIANLFNKVCINQELSTVNHIFNILLTKKLDKFPEHMSIWDKSAIQAYKEDWSKLIKKIRTAALQKMESILSTILNNNDAIRFLEFNRNEPLFNRHRDISFGRTDAVIRIDELLDHYRRQANKMNQPAI